MEAVHLDCPELFQHMSQNKARIGFANQIHPQNIFEGCQPCMSSIGSAVVDFEVVPDFPEDGQLPELPLLGFQGDEHPQVLTCHTDSGNPPPSSDPYYCYQLVAVNVDTKSWTRTILPVYNKIGVDQYLLRNDLVKLLSQFLQKFTSSLHVGRQSIGPETFNVPGHETIDSTSYSFSNIIRHAKLIYTEGALGVFHQIPNTQCSALIFNNKTNARLHMMVSLIALYCRQEIMVTLERKGVERLTFVQQQCTKPLFIASLQSRNVTISSHPKHVKDFGN
jgi:hypothetical protein